MPFIKNISYAEVDEVRTGDVLIQIVDPCMEPPVPKLHTFKETHVFEFLDAEEGDIIDAEFKIQRAQAKAIIGILKSALDRDLNVVVHCVAGVCRSGAVTEVGVALGFKDTMRFRQPNLMVKHYLMRELGWTYDADEKPYDVNQLKFDLWNPEYD